jgi:CHAT domain-containing protein/tetratricopeptide (TPR) repeat protein
MRRFSQIRCRARNGLHSPCIGIWPQFKAEIPVLIKTFVIIGLLLSPVLGFAQSTERRIETKTEFVFALCRSDRDQGSREILLRSHPELVNSQLWKDLSDLASAAYVLSPKQSLDIYEVAIQVADQLHDPKLIAITYYNSGRIYSASNQFSKAIEVYEKSRGYFERAGLQRDLIYLLADLGASYFILEDFQKAKDYSEQSIALAEKLKGADSPAAVLPDDYGRARALQTLADINLRDGDHAQAIEKLQMSLALYQQLNRGDSSYNFYIAGDLMALGRVYTEASDNVRALFYLNKAVEIVRTLNDKDMMASLRNSIGVLYTEQEDYAQAKAQFDQSLRIYSGENNQRETARVLLNLGVLEQRLGNYDEALSHFKLSFQGAEATKSIDVTIAAGEGIGVVLTAKKDFVGALESFNRSLAVARETKNKTRQTELLWRSAQVYYEIGDYSHSATLAESAAAMARSAHLPKLTYLATTSLGQSYAAQSRFELAIQTLKQAVQQIEAMRDEVAGREVESQVFLESKVASYHNLVDLLTKQGKTVEALLYAERAKGRVLLDVLRSGKPDLAKVLTPTERQEIQRLNRKITEVNDRIKKQETANSSSLNSLYAELDGARLDYQSFQDAVYVAHPDLSMRSGHTATLSTADLDRLTQNNDTGYLEYVVGKDRVSLFVLTKDKTTGASDLKVYPLAIKPADLVRKVNEFHDTLAEQRPAYASAAGELYSLLVEPAEQQLRSLGTICIVPDSFLWNLPFQALMTRSEHFLIEDHALYYAPSLTVLREMNQRKLTRGETASSLIAFGNPVIGKDDQRDADLCPLPEAEQEVSSIAKALGLKGSKVFIGREASEKTFKALASTYSIIHLATHGVIDNRQPLYSHLLLTKTEGDPENDGRLEARQIMDMNLNADLAVLSACETANGKVAPGEGVIGMSWAFFVARTRSILVSQWKVDSLSTSQLMLSFYQSLATEQNLSEMQTAKALRRSSLRLMRDERYRHPFYWAGFVLVGGHS